MTLDLTDRVVGCQAHKCSSINNLEAQETQLQNRYLRANCRILGSSEFRTTPNCDELRFTSMAPDLKLFNTLYASARNSILCVSRKRKTRESDTSNCQVGGNLNVARPRFPRVPGAGCPKAARF